MAIIKVNSLEEIELPNRSIIDGNNGYIFKYGSRYFKLLSFRYMNLDERVNFNRLRILEQISVLKGTKYLVLPKDIYMTDKEIFGYTMDICPGKEFNFLLDGVSYDLAVNAVLNLLEDIKKLSDLGILNLDICSSNILFDDINLYWLDFDNSVYFDDKEKAYLMMATSLVNLSLGKILDLNRLELFDDIDINYMKAKIDGLESSNYKGFLWLIKAKTQEILGKESLTVGDMRRVLKKCEFCDGSNKS